MPDHLMTVPDGCPGLVRPDPRHWLWLAVGIGAVGAGVAAFVWPSAAVQVVGVLFGLNLIVIGVVRAGLLLFLSGFPLLYRVAGVGFAAVTVVAGIACLGHRAASVVVLLVVVGFGWVFDGVIELFIADGAGDEASGGRWIGTGLLMVLAAVALWHWPQRGFPTLVAIGAAALIVAGVGRVISAVTGLRAGRAHAGR